MAASPQAQPLEGIERLNALLDDPETLAGLESFVDKLPDLNAAIDLISSFFASSSRIAENTNGILRTARDAFVGSETDEQISRFQRVAETGSVLADELGEPLSDPQTIESVKQLIEMLPKLVAMLSILEQFMSSSSRFAENLNQVVKTARDAANEKWPDIMKRQDLLELPGHVLNIVDSPNLKRLLKSRVLSEEALETMDGVADAIIEARAKNMETDARVSPFGLFRAMGDPDVQRGLALTIEMARGVGKRMRSDGASSDA